MTTQTNTPPPVDTPEALSVEQVTNSPAPTPLPVQDATFLFAEICYEALASLAGQRLVIGDDVALAALYNGLDALCEDEIPRPAFDFNTQILVVVVDFASACHAEFIPLGLENNILMLQFRQSGTCAYEVLAVYAGTLIRPAGELQVIVNAA